MGSSTSGVSSGLQASRLGAKTCMLEESSWGPMTTYVGGMISAFDGPFQNYPNINAACNQVFCASTGIFAEIERAIHKYPNYCDYYPCEKLAKGSVSVSAFEPEVARTVLNGMIGDEANLKNNIYYNMSVATVLLNTSGSKPRVIGVTATNATGTHTFYANVTIDATELGDVVALANVASRIGREINATTGEPHALGGAENIECSGPTCVADNKTQAFNIAFVIKDYGTGTSATKPTDYDANKYKYAAPYGDLGLPWNNYITYGYTPNSDYNGTDRFNYKKNFQNWPNYGNDFAFYNTTFSQCSGKASIVEMNKTERDCLLAKARNHSLNFLYFLKTEPYCNGWLNCSKATTQASCGNTGYLCWWNVSASKCVRNDTIGASCAMITDQARCNGNNTVNCSWALNISEASNWGIFDVFGAPDKLAAIPYYRESRHIVGLYQLKEQDISQATNPSGRGKLFNNSIAIGDFPMDVHATKAHPNKNNSFNNDSLGHLNIPTYPFQIPYGVLIPNDTDGLIVAEKSISVTHVAAGATRLQPVVTLIGQAAGAAAALSAQKGIQPRNLDVRELQKVLINQSERNMLFYFSDVPGEHPRFKAIQVLALDGVAQGYGMEGNYTFKPDQNVTRLEAGLFVRRALELDTSWWWNYSNTSRWVANVLDINDTDNYSKAYYIPFWKDVQALYANNITKGCEMVNETTTPVKIKFCPNRTIWRSEIITFMTRSRHLQGYNKTIDTFYDVNNTYWAYRDIEAAYADYIIDDTDYDATWHLRPSDNATRADVVHWVYRGVKRFNTAPTQLRVNITSIANLTCITDSLNDVDYDNISVVYRWSRNSAYRAKLLMPFDVDEKDYSGYNNIVNITGPVAFRRRGELQGGRMDFNGINTSINVTNSSLNGLSFPDNLTIEAWIMKRGSTSWAGIVSKAQPGYNDGHNYNLRENSTSGAIEFRVVSGAINYNVTSTAPLLLNAWYHVVGVRSGTTLSLYINGNLNNSMTIGSGQLNTGNYPVMIGAAFNANNYNPPRYFNGSIDEVRIYDYALSPAQIEMHSKRLYNMTAQQKTRNYDIWKCEVTPNDGYHNGIALNSTTVTITNGWSGSGMFGGDGSFGVGNEGSYGEIIE